MTYRAPDAVPLPPQDVVLMFCTASGWRDGRLARFRASR